MKYDRIRSYWVKGQIMVTYTQAVRILFNKTYLWKFVKRESPAGKRDCDHEKI